MKQFVEDAIAGGWRKYDIEKCGYDASGWDTGIFLDPHLWKAVGKTRWEEKCSNPDHGFIDVMSFCDIGRIGCPVCGHDDNRIVASTKNIWKEKMHTFLDCLIEGLSIEEALKEIR